MIVPSQIASDIETKKGAFAKVYFPNLDGLRFLSFLLVFLSHSLSADYSHIRDAEWYKYVKLEIFHDGDLGVSFFFVLSGFLITYLLLKEREVTGKINISFFYIRRALRIWPLYFFCVFFGFQLFPILKTMFGQIPDETADPFLSSLFLNNFDIIINGPPDSSVLSILWSIAIEEQFYLIWPILFIVIPSRYFIYIFLGTILISTGFRSFAPQDQIEIHTLGVIADMAIGGLGAYLSLNRKNAMLTFFENTPRLLHLSPYIIAVLFVLLKNEIFSFNLIIIFKRIIIATIFLWIILDQNFNPRSYFKISSFKYLSRFGKYTYGLYCFHSIGILISVTILRRLQLNTESYQLIFYELPLSMLISIVISVTSYHLFEIRFLKLKDRFAYIRKE